MSPMVILEASSATCPRRWRRALELAIQQPIPSHEGLPGLPGEGADVHYRHGKAPGSLLTLQRHF